MNECNSHTITPAPVAAAHAVTTTTAEECLDLRRSHVRLCGRENELAVLKVAYTKITTDVDPPTATSVFIRGESGSGKSALIRQFRRTLIESTSEESRDPNTSTRCLFCRGKFEEGGAAVQPFSTVLQACTSMIQQLLNTCTGPNQLDVWRRRFHSELSKQDSAIVQNMIPSLRNLLRHDPTTNSFESTESNTSDTLEQTNTGSIRTNRQLCRRGRYDITEYVPTKEIFDPSDTEFSFDRLRFALRSLIRAVSQFVPVVLFLDDMQWAGEDSLVLIQTFIYDKMPGRRLLLLGAYRPVPDHHPLSLRILNEPADHRMIGRTRTGQVDQAPWIDIHLKNLDVVATSELIASVLKLQDEREAEAFSEFVVERTNGNPFTILQLLHLLENEKLIYFSNEMRRWMWQSGDVICKNQSVSFIGGFVNQKILSLPSRHQLVLGTAACLGVLQFNDALLTLALDSTWNDATDGETLSPAEILRGFATVGFLEQTGSIGEYRFAHDRIREAAYSLSARDDDQHFMHLAIGRRLLRAWQSNSAQVAGHVSRDFEEEIMLHAVNQMNLGASHISSLSERHILAEMNHVIAKMAISRSAFYPAADFLRMGLSMLCADDEATQAIEWQQNYPLMLKLYIDKAKVDYCCGSWQSAITHADAVLSHATSVFDKAPAYMTKILCLAQTDRIFEARELIISALEQLGVSFPPERIRRRAAIAELLRVKRMLSRYSSHDILHLKETTDRFANLTSEFFMQLLRSTYLGHADPALLTLAILRGVRMTITNGKFRFSGICFVFYGTTMAHIRSYAEAYNYGKIGLQMVEAEGHYAVDAIIAFHAYLAHWQHPIHRSIHQLAKLVRHFSYSEMYTSVFVVISFACGRRLGDMTRDILQSAESLLDYKQDVLWDHYAPLYQLVSILTENRVPSHLNLSGRYMVEDELLENAKSVRTKVHIFLFKLYLVCILGDLGSASELLSAMDKLQHLQAPNPDFMHWNFFIGLASFEVARSCSPYSRRCRRYKRKGRVKLRSFRTWEAKGVVNASFFLLLLQAELDRLSCEPERSRPSDIERVLKRYDEAIDMIVSRSENYYFHIRGLANERAAAFCIEHNLKAQAAQYMTQARNIYAEWGAVAKVMQLEDKYSSLLFV